MSDDAASFTDFSASSVYPLPVHTFLWAREQIVEFRVVFDAAEPVSYLSVSVPSIFRQSIEYLLAREQTAMLNTLSDGAASSRSFGSRVFYLLSTALSEKKDCTLTGRVRRWNQLLSQLHNQLPDA